jgi:gamma-glutamylcyclotransferase (GGCT)/AIG2-like uncharacterized protein YtfP
MITHSTFKQPEPHVFIAVYGSLRRGMGNEDVNKDGDGVFYFSGETWDNHDIFEHGTWGSFPSVSLKHSDSAKPVQVELFRAPRSGLLGAYDSLEGHDPDSEDGGFYNRSLVPIRIHETGDLVEAWIYHIDHVTGLRVESGDWVKHKCPTKDEDDEDS